MNQVGDDGICDSLVIYHSSSDSGEQYQEEVISYLDKDEVNRSTNEVSLVIGTQFEDAASFREFIRWKAITENFGMRFKKSDRKRVVAICAHIGCPWRIRASLCADGQTFEVRKLEDSHLCPGINRAGNRQATSMWVAHEIEDIVKKDPEIAPRQINNNLETKYGLSLPYMKLWRSRELARENLFGAVNDNYRWVPALRAELVARNPGSHVIFDYNDDDHSFRRFFISFRVCIEGFLVGCRHLIGLDACHLKSKYLGVLLAANALDGNNGLFTIAFAVVESESKSSWQWFLKHLAEAFECDVPPLAFISDMEKGLAEAMQTIFPCSEHRVCMRHLWKNIKKFNKCRGGQKIQNIVWSSANSYAKYDYDSRMNDLFELSPQVYSYLNGLPYKWSKSQFSIDIKNQANTNNMSESFNAWIREAREKPIVDLVDTIRGMIMTQRSERKEKSAQWNGYLVPAAEEYIRDITTEKKQFIIRQSTTAKAEIEGNHERHEVDIRQRECSCMRWQMTGLPCIHAVTFIGTKDHISWHDYLDEYYHTSRYIMAYDGAIATLPGRNQWIVPVDNVCITAPNSQRPRGRPRKRRLKSFLEVTNKCKSVHRCSRCNGWGHHKNTCKDPISHSSSEMPAVDTTTYVSELTYADMGARAKLPVRRDRLD